jgi:quinol monooxygenase YgiN
MVYTLTVHLYANDEPGSVEKIKAKLIEAARVYRKDKETVDWLVMQDVHDPRAFSIVERFENESVSFRHYCPDFARVDQRFPSGCRARDTTSRIPTGRPSTLTSCRCWLSPWT